MAIIKLYYPKQDDDGEDKDPEIIIDDEEHPKEKVGFFAGMRQRLAAFIVIRFFCIVIGVVALFFTFFYAFLFAVSLLICLVTFFQVSAARQGLSDRWKYVKLGTICTTGLVLALFSPLLGITMIASYCMMNVQDPTNTFLLRFLEHRIRDFKGNDH